jgi:S1-C subfamily serine protease
VNTFAFTLLVAVAGPTDAEWAAIEACPQVSVPDSSTGTGVVIGQKDDRAYLLTAAHVVPLDGVVIRFTTREKYPAAVWSVGSPTAEVVARWPDPDVALVRLAVPKDRTLRVLPLAGPGQRPKRFPFDGRSVGLTPGDNGLAATARAERVLAKRFVRRPGREPAFFWETQDPPEPGRSGGPLLDDAGRVIGLCAANRDGRGYFTHLDEILAALKRDGHGWLVGP